MTGEGRRGPEDPRRDSEAGAAPDGTAAAWADAGPDPEPIRRTGPPDDWLERVRRAAPGLLLGTPWAIGSVDARVDGPPATDVDAVAFAIQGEAGEARAPDGTDRGRPPVRGEGPTFGGQAHPADPVGGGGSAAGTDRAAEPPAGSGAAQPPIRRSGVAQVVGASEVASPPGHHPAREAAARGTVHDGRPMIETSGRSAPRAPSSSEGGSAGPETSAAGLRVRDVPVLGAVTDPVAPTVDGVPQRSAASPAGWEPPVVAGDGPGADDRPPAGAMAQASVSSVTSAIGLPSTDANGSTPWTDATSDHKAGAGADAASTEPGTARPLPPRPRGPRSPDEGAMAATAPVHPPIRPARGPSPALEGPATDPWRPARTEDDADLRSAAPPPDRWPSLPGSDRQTSTPGIGAVADPWPALPGRAIDRHAPPALDDPVRRARLVAIQRGW